MLEDPWQDRAIPIRFSDESASAEAILELARTSPLDGVLAVGDRPTVIASLVQEGLGFPGHPAAAAAAARNKLLTREHLRALAPPNHWFRPISLAMDPRELAASISFPCVLKPLALSGSRGVMRVDDGAELVAVFHRLRLLLGAPDLRGEPRETRDLALVEGFIEGREFALEGLMNHGTLHLLAIFDKPDPLDGPFFEETIYVTPSTSPPAVQDQITTAIAEAASALGLFHGPVHAECRVNDRGVYVLEVAARPIGGLCGRALQFAGPGGETAGLEELLLRHALGEPVEGWTREPIASGVMMIPIPAGGIYRRAHGVEAAEQVEAVCEIRITAKPDQALVPLPEGSSYLGFIFAKGPTPTGVEVALREAHGRLTFDIDRRLVVL
jgi:hypothetical protein